MWPGIYFAEKAKYSDGYAFKQAGGKSAAETRVFLLVQLLVGEFKDMPSDRSLRLLPLRLARAAALGRRSSPLSQIH